MCTDLLKMMDSYGVLKRFYLKCIDDMERIPDGLERVPTLIVVGVGKPLVAKEAVSWFNQMRPMFVQENVEMQQKRIINNMMRNNIAGGPKGYAQGEYDGISDTFAYTDVDMAQPKTFCDYGKGGEDVIYTPPRDGAKMVEADQKKYVLDLESERKRHEVEYSTVMKRDQIDAVMNRERDTLMREKLGI